MTATCSHFVAEAEVRKHIDGLIDCINELFFERKMVKYEYEKVAITLCSVEYQYKVMKKKEGRDTVSEDKTLIQALFCSGKMCANDLFCFF